MTFLVSLTLVSHDRAELSPGWTATHLEAHSLASYEAVNEYRSTKQYNDVQENKAFESVFICYFVSPIFCLIVIINLNIAKLFKTKVKNLI